MRVFPIVLLSLLTGCASFVHGSMQSVSVATPDVDGAFCTLTDTAGRVYQIASTPGSTSVRRGDGPIAVICKKPGYSTGTGQLSEGIASATYANILMPPGFLIDAITGGGEAYVSNIDIDMEPVASTKATAKPWE